MYHQLLATQISPTNLMRALFLIALAVVGWLIYKLYFKKFWNQGKPGKVKLAMIALGILFLGLALTGRAPALLAVIGAAMTQIVRLAPLLIRFAPSLRSVLGAGAAGGARAGVSKVSTPTIDMTLDNATGQINGYVKTGEFKGQELSALTLEQLQSLYRQCQANDTEALRLLQTYISRERDAEWQSHGNQGDYQSSDRSTPATSSEMGIEEARAVLAVSSDATKSEIVAAHRSLMGKLHPDKGGNNYLAVKVNTAKSVLLDHLKKK